MISTRLTIGLLVGVLLAACDQPKTPPSDRNDSGKTAAEQWASRPAADWPQLVLTNSAEFHRHSSLKGASAFLVRAPDGRILAATALHLLGVNGGVEPTVQPAQFTRALSSWQIYPRTKPEAAVTVAGLGCSLPLRRNSDWLLLSLGPDAKDLPSLPLKLRRKPIPVGEEVFLVGVPYSEPERAQNVYRGRVTERGHGDRFRFTIDPPVDLRGFSGAPILDSSGSVAGVMTVWFKAKMQGEKYLEAGGEDAASVLDQLATRP